MKVGSGLVYVSLIVVVLFSASLSHAEIPLENLAGAWLFDKDAGDTVKDHSGNDNHAKTVGDPKWVKGKIGAALEFDGKDDYLEIKNSKSLNVGVNDFTLVASLNPAGEEGDGIIAKGAWCWNGGWILQIGVKPGVGFFAGHIALEDLCQWQQ